MKWIAVVFSVLVVCAMAADDKNAADKNAANNNAAKEEAESPKTADTLKTEEENSEVENKTAALEQASEGGAEDTIAKQEEEHTKSTEAAKEKLNEEKELAEKEVKEENTQPNTAEDRPMPMEPASNWPGNKERPPASRPEYRCEICMMMVLRKLERQDLCSGLQHQDDLETCRAAVETLTVYDRYVVDWLYGDGCQRKVDLHWQNVKPCPAHVVCSWMIHTFSDGEKRTFCQFEDSTYRRSPAFHQKHHIPTKEYSLSEEKDLGTGPSEEERHEHHQAEQNEKAEVAQTEQSAPSKTEKAKGL